MASSDDSMIAASNPVACSAFTISVSGLSENEAETVGERSERV